MGQVNAFLAADARLEHDRLSTTLTLQATAAQGSREGIRQLHAQLHAQLQQGAHG